MLADFKNVLFVGPLDTYGGMGSVIRTYAKMSPVFYFIPTHDGSCNNKYKYFVISLFKIIKFLIFHQEVKIVHIHTASNNSYIRKTIVLYLSKILQRSVVLHIHGGGFVHFYNRNFILKKYIDYTLKYTDQILCISNEVRNHLTCLSLKRKIILLENPIVASPKSRSIEFNGVLKLLYLGNITPQKGIFDLLVYLHNSSLYSKGLIELTIAGSGDTETLNKKINQLGLKENIFFVGWVDSETKIDAFFNNHIFILPSYYEGLPVSILEAISTGMPVIATSVGGIPDIIKHHINGWLFNPSNFHELDYIFDDIFSHPYLIKQFGDSSKEIISPYLSSSVFEKLLEIYSDLL